MGTQYRTGIYYHNENQRIAALGSKEEVRKKLNVDIAVEVEGATVWYKAEEYHQQYLAKGGQCSLTGDLSPIRCYG